MKILAIALTALTMSAAVGCKKSDSSGQAGAKVADKAAEAKLTNLTVAELETKLAAGECMAVDANSESTRKRMGTVPGAVLLTDHETFPVSELPADKAKQLVFYCGGEKCMASHVAAKRAKEQGYTNVAIMSAGIAGWTEAGKKVTTM